MADLGTQCPERVVDHLFSIGAEENEVARFGAGAREDRLQRGRGKKLDDRRLQPVLVGFRGVVDLDVREPAGAVDLDEGRIVVDLLARQSRFLQATARHRLTTTMEAMHWTQRV